MLTVGELLNQSLELYKKHFKLLAGYAAWLLLPYAGVILISLIPSSDPLWEIPIMLGNLIQGLIGLWLAIFIPLLVRSLLAKEKNPPTDLSQKTWQLLPSVIFVALVEAIVIFGGLILLIVPGIIFWIWFAFSQMAVIFDNKKGLAALNFSRELVRGKFWPVIWRLLSGPIIIGSVTVVVSGLIIVAVSLATGTSFATNFGETLPLWADVVATIFETFVIPLLMIYMTALYFDLRNAVVANYPADGGLWRGPVRGLRGGTKNNKGTKLLLYETFRTGHRS